MKSNSAEQLRHFYEANRRELFTYALSITRNRENAEDVIHNVISNLLNNGKLPKEMRPYIFRAVRNGAIDALRREQPAAASASMYATKGVEDPSLGLVLQDALDQLNADERDAVVMKAYGGLTFKEISLMRGVSINTAASWYRRALEKLKTILEEIPNGRP